MSTETTNKKIKIDNGTTFGRTYTDKAVDERLQGLVSTATFTPVKEKANNSLQKPAGLTKTELVGVGTNGQENIEIGDNLKLENGKLSATGGGGGDAFDIITSTDGETYTGTISGTKPVIINAPGINYVLSSYSSDYAYLCDIQMGGSLIAVIKMKASSNKIQFEEFNLQKAEYSHFITMTNSNDNVALYFTIQNTSEDIFTIDTLATYLSNKKVLANGNLHGVVPTYIEGDGSIIKIYYMTPGDSNINLTPDEYQNLFSFTITDLVKPVE